MNGIPDPLICTLEVGDRVKCIDASGNAASYLKVGDFYTVCEVGPAGLALRIVEGGIWLNRERFAYAPIDSIVAETLGQEETKPGKPLIASPAPIRTFRLPLPLRCAICGSCAAGSDIAWAGFSYAAKPDERQHFCPSCSEQVASFIAHLKGKSSWYNPDVDD